MPTDMFTSSVPHGASLIGAAFIDAYLKSEPTRQKTARQAVEDLTAATDNQTVQQAVESLRESLWPSEPSSDDKRDLRLWPMYNCPFTTRTAVISGLYGDHVVAAGDGRALAFRVDGMPDGYSLVGVACFRYQCDWLVDTDDVTSRNASMGWNHCRSSVKPQGVVLDCPGADDFYISLPDAEPLERDGSIDVSLLATDGRIWLRPTEPRYRQWPVLVQAMGRDSRELAREIVVPSDNGQEFSLFSDVLERIVSIQARPVGKHDLPWLSWALLPKTSEFRVCDVRIETQPCGSISVWVDEESDLAVSDCRRLVCLIVDKHKPGDGDDESTCYRSERTDSVRDGR